MLFWRSHICLILRHSLINVFINLMPAHEQCSICQKFQRGVGQQRQGQSRGTQLPREARQLGDRKRNAAYRPPLRTFWPCQRGVEHIAKGGRTPRPPQQIEPWYCGIIIFCMRLSVWYNQVVIDFANKIVSLCLELVRVIGIFFKCYIIFFSIQFIQTVCHIK